MLITKYFIYSNIYIYIYNVDINTLDNYLLLDYNKLLQYLSDSIFIYIYIYIY